MTVYGIDISTKKIAVAKILPDGFDVVELTAKSRSWESRLQQLYPQFFEYVSKTMVTDDFVVIEDVPLVQNRAALIKLTHFVAMCKVVCLHHEIDCFPVNVKTWKRSVLGDGNADKDKIRSMAKQIFGAKISKLSQDGVDALCVAKWGDLRVRGND
jgi:Holliday junction resolvasome RuvABC endonuclease subunit